MSPEHERAFAECCLLLAEVVRLTHHPERLREVDAQVSILTGTGDGLTRAIRWHWPTLAA